jgi:lipopolysaccharide transport system ATP-binding protein
MSNITVRVENLAKMYRIGAKEEQARGVGQKVRSLATSPFAYLSRMRRPPTQDETLWALRDVSFEVERGEAVGVLGRNGAGKSTLLKILARITEPTSGRAEIHGRVGSLLEVGTGFHPELTGRENIYLNGAILGMRRYEIDRRFDEIVAFAEIEKFLDTPVKRYSSGMYVRLAFAVAAHLEPEVLLVDEVLAVGDAAFQKKCLGKMSDVAEEGRTILFISHNLVAMQSLCDRAIWINEGRMVDKGSTSQVISNYLQTNFSAQTEQLWNDSATAPGNDMVRLHRVCVRPEDGSGSDMTTMQTPLAIEVEFWNLIPDARLHITIHLYTEQQIVAFTTGSLTDPIWRDRPFPVGLFRSVCHIPGSFLNSGTHRVLLLVVQNLDTVIYRHEDILTFDVHDLEKRPGHWLGKEPGVVQPALQWITEYLAGGMQPERPGQAPNK